MEPTNPSQPTNSTNSDAAEPVSPVDAASNQSDPTPAQSTQNDTANTVTPQVAAPLVPGGPVVNGAQVNPVNTVTQPVGKKKWLIPALAGGAAVLLLAGGYVFGMYLPNRPEALFSASLERSGQAVDKLVDYTKTSAKSAAQMYEGSLVVQSSGVSMDATLKGESDDTNATLTMDANVSGQKFTADMIAIDAKQSEMPDVYVKVSGVKSFLEQAGGSQLASLDSQWIGVDHTLLDTYLNQQEESLGTNTSMAATPTGEQMRDALAKMQEVNKQYLFNGDKDKAVVTYKKYVGKETKNGREVNHYEAGYNKENLKAYVDAVAKALDGSKLNDWAKQQADGKKVSEMLNVDELKKSIDSLKADETFALYIDVKTKIVQSVVFDLNKDKTKLTVAQNYTGGDVYPLEFAVESTDSADKGKAVIGMDINTQSNAVTVKVDFDMTGVTAKMDLKMTPTDKKVTVSAPTGVKPVTDVMKQLGLDESVLGAQTLLPNIAGSAL